jgi:hypothetical protein
MRITPYLKQCCVLVVHCDLGFDVEGEREENLWRQKGKNY